MLNTNQNPSHQCKIIILLEGKIYYLTKKGNKIHVTIKINSASGYNCILPLNLEIKLGTFVSWTDERLHALLIDVCFEKKKIDYQSNCKCLDTCLSKLPRIARVSYNGQILLYVVDCTTITCDVIFKVNSISRDALSKTRLFLEHLVAPDLLKWVTLIWCLRYFYWILEFN